MKGPEGLPMGNKREIWTRANAIVRKYGGGTRDPFRIADAKGYTIESLYVRPDGTKGFAKLLPGRHIFLYINRNLSEEMQRMTCAHELGHAVLHRRDLAQGILCEFDLFEAKTTLEYEANLFAAYLLMDEKEVIREVSEGCSLEWIASHMGVHQNFAALLIRSLDARGKLPADMKVPDMPDCQFLGALTG